MDSHVHTRVNDFLLRLRESRKDSRLLRGERVSGGHLKAQLVSAEEQPQNMRHRTTDVGVTRRVLGEVGRVDQWLPAGVDRRGWIAVLVAEPDCGDRSPEVIEVLAVPARYLGVSHGGCGEGKHARGITRVPQVA